MRGITKYILRQLVGAMLFVTLALTGVVWLSNSLRFVDLMVNRGLTIGTFFHFTLLLLPTFLWVILPFSLFCAVIYTYHRLTRHVLGLDVMRPPAYSITNTSVNIFSCQDGRWGVVTLNEVRHLETLEP